jgi:DNA-binding response OmpR family regulator
VVGRGDQALDRFRDTQPDLVILDLTLPGIDGLVVCRQLRQLSAVPILILTAREDSFDEVSGPNRAPTTTSTNRSSRACCWRACAHCNGVAPASPAAISCLASCASRARTAPYTGAQEVPMNSAEFKLFLILADASGKVMSRNDILVKMRGIEFDGLDRSIDNCVSRLRRKFGDSGTDRIKTVWGEGYLFSPSAWE